MQQHLYARALDAAGVPSEVHLFAKGKHAFGLRPTKDPVTHWPTLVETWLKGIGIMYSRRDPFLKLGVR